MEHIDIEIENEDVNFKLRANGILICKNKVLCTEMNENEFYCLPGGHVELGEDSKKAAVREFKEETGIETSISKLVAITENFFTRKTGKKVHEISFYYILNPKEDIQIKQEEYDVIEIDKGEKKKHHFKWIDIINLYNENFKPIEIRNKLESKNFDFEQIIIK